MKILTIRQKLMIYLADADDSKIEAVYTLLEKDIHDKTIVNLSREQLEILDNERKIHLSGQTKSYTRREANQIVKTMR
ncbi:hypothetical protein ACEN9X_16515 [Mucilaginibacter sp. Mucisp86]|uniref:hypothetical protein n=1 Tax=Mucilaginibacter sp. Mucisp86 TaxID=3243060 RepID=UPI0039B4DC16